MVDLICKVVGIAVLLSIPITVAYLFVTDWLYKRSAQYTFNELADRNKTEWPGPM